MIRAGRALPPWLCSVMVWLNRRASVADGAKNALLHKTSMVPETRSHGKHSVRFPPKDSFRVTILPDPL